MSDRDRYLMDDFCPRCTSFNRDGCAGPLDSDDTPWRCRTCGFDASVDKVPIRPPIFGNLGALAALEAFTTAHPQRENPMGDYHCNHHGENHDGECPSCEALLRPGRHEPCMHCGRVAYYMTNDGFRCKPCANDETRLGSKLRYTVGDATAPFWFQEMPMQPRIIAHVCNDIGRWGRGFVTALSKRWPQPETNYREWHGSESFRLGIAQFAPVEERLVVANMVAQRGIGRGVRVDYAALATCLSAVSLRALTTGASVHMPRIGVGLGGGDWAAVEPIIQRELCAVGVWVMVYDLKRGGP